MVSSTAPAAIPARTRRVPADEVRYLHVSRPNGAHSWHGPFGLDEAGGAALLSWLRVYAPVVPTDATWDVTRTTQPEEDS